MRRRVEIAAELRRLEGSFLAREIRVRRDIESKPNLYGHTTRVTKLVDVRVVDLEGTHSYCGY